MHVLLMFVFYESVSSWLLVFLAHDEVNALYVSILLKLSSQFTLTCVVVDSCNKEGFERITSFFFGGIWVPDGDLLF